MSDKCYHCGCYHEGACPRVKSIEHGPNGTVKTEYHDPSDHLRQQLADTERLLAESQAREKALEDGLLALCYLKSIKESVGKTAEYIAEQPKAWEKARELLAMPSDSTALDAMLAQHLAKAKREVLLEAAEFVGRNLYDNKRYYDELYRMADEVGQAHRDLKGGEQG